MIIFGITTKVNKDKVNKKLLRVAKVIKAIRRETKTPHMSEPGRKKADTKHPPALVPTVVGDGYLNVFLPVGLANRFTDCLCVSYLQKNLCSEQSWERKDCSCL